MLAIILVGLLSFAAAAQSPSAKAGRHVLVISVDGMGSFFYMKPAARVSIPNIRRLMKEGVFAEAVEGVYPTVTYPSHTTLVTGRMPAEHGIYTNLSSREPGKNPDDWFWFSKSIKVPTLWDEARAHHLTTASVAWPVTTGAAIDWNLPEIWDPAKGETPDMMYVARFMNPLVGAELLGALGPPKPDVDNDSFKTRIAGYFIKNHTPGLTLVHFTDLDAAEHGSGPSSTQAAAALEKIDGDIGELVQAVKDAGLAGSTDIFVLSDHGFKDIHQVINPNVLLARAGLLTADAQGNVTGGKIATVSNGGSFFIYWPRGESGEYRERVASALKPLRDPGLLWAVFDHQALTGMRADPDARMALEAADGASFGDAAGGAAVVKLSQTQGTHGFLPTRDGLESSFIAAGPDIKAGVDLHRIRMIRIGPTILKAMGIRDPSFGDAPPLEGIWRRVTAFRAPRG